MNEPKVIRPPPHSLEAERAAAPARARHKWAVTRTIHNEDYETPLAIQWSCTTCGLVKRLTPMKRVGYYGQGNNGQSRCPPCGMSHSQYLEQLREEYVQRTVARWAADGVVSICPVCRSCSKRAPGLVCGRRHRRANGPCSCVLVSIEQDARSWVNGSLSSF